MRGVLILSGLVLFGVRIVLVFELGKFGSHRWVAARESLDRQVFGFIVGKPKIVGGLVQGFFGLFKVLDGFVDALDRFFKPI